MYIKLMLHPYIKYVANYFSYIQGRSQTSPDGRAQFLNHTTIVSYIANYWHAGSYVQIFIGVLKSAKYDYSYIYKVV